MQNIPLMNESKNLDSLNNFRLLALRPKIVRNTLQTVSTGPKAPPSYDTVGRELDLKSVPRLPQTSIIYYDMIHITLRCTFPIIKWESRYLSHTDVSNNLFWSHPYSRIIEWVLDVVFFKKKKRSNIPVR